MRKNYSQKGFTLIELLIVIVIIGILAGVLIAVINPVQQQNRARDATTQASMNKIGLVAQAHVSAYGRAPTETELLDALSDVTDMDDCTETASTAAQDCVFDVGGSDLPVTCDGNFEGDATDACYFRYYKGTAADGWVDEHFRIHAKSWGLSGRSFIFDSTESVVYQCDSTVDLDGEIALDALADCERFGD